MPDTDITVRFEAQDDLSPVIDKINGELDKIGQGSVNRLQTAQKGLAESTREVSFATEQWGELMAGIGYQIGAWNIGFFLAQKALDLMTDGFKNATTMAQDFTEQMNISRSSTAEEVQALDELKRAAEESGMNLGDDFTKFVMPSVRALEELGLTEKQAGEETKVLGQYMRAFGVDMRDLATKVELGTASFDDLLKAGLALGPMFEQEVLAWKKFEVAEAEGHDRLMRYRQTLNETYEDTQRLASAHEGFAASTGLASAAFKAFQSAQVINVPRQAVVAEIPRALADLPGGRAAFGKLLGEMQKDFKDGISQIAKEENLPEQLVRAGVKAGLPGFDEQSLLSAHKRAVEEKEIARHRSEEAEDFARRNAAEQERIKLNRDVEGSLKQQVGYEAQAVDLAKAFNNYCTSIKGTTDKIGEGWAKIGIGIGDALNRSKQGAEIVGAQGTGAKVSAATDILGTVAGAGPVGALAQLLADAVGKRTPAAVKGEGDFIKAITDGFSALIKMLEGH